jgi:hypothetical protein
MKKIAFLTLTAAVLSLGCKKSSSNNTTTPDSYQNTAANSTWNYRSTDNTGGTPPTNYTQTSTNRDTSINGKSYHVFTISTGGNNYLNKTGSTYWQYASLGAGVNSNIERQYLDDNAAVGNTWSKAISVDTTINGTTISIPLLVTSTISQKGIARTVNNVNYTNVIDVKVDVKLNCTGIACAFYPISFTTDIHEYYAPKYGLIERQAKATVTITGSAPQSFDNSTILLSADLK